MKPLFDCRYTYPSDHEGGRYVELIGEVTEVSNLLGDYWQLTVKTAEHGEHSGFIPRIGTGQPQVGHQARIRIYDAGGGWYPDNKIMSYGVSTI